MATTSSTTKAKQDLTKTKSLNRKPKAPSSVSSEDGSSEQKPEKPLPNYLKPTISSRPDPVKFLKKNNNSLEDNQKLLRRRSFDRPPSSLTSPSTSSSPHFQKSLTVSPSLPRDRPTVPREKPVTAQRSSSFHGSRGVPRGGTIVKSPHVATKKSGLSSSSTSLKSKKESSPNVTIVKASDKEIPLDSASLASAQEDDHQEEILKVESDVHVADDIEEPKDEKVTQEVHVEAESGEENESGGPTMVASSPVIEGCIVVVVAKEDEKEEVELINDDKTEEKIEETKEQENNQDKKGEEEEEVLKKNIDDEHESPKKVDIDMKEVESVNVTTKEKEEEELKEEEKVEEVKEEKKDEEVKEEEKEKVKEEEKEKVKEEEVKKKEVVKGKKESPSAYNDVIASKMQENPRKNKVLALAGAFQTVIDYETTAASK